MSTFANKRYDMNKKHNLKIIKSHSDSWKKYFDIEVCRKYQKILDMLIKEHWLDPSFTGEMYVEKIKELMTQELSKKN